MNYIIMFFAGIIGIFLYTLRKIKGIRQRNPGIDFKKAFSSYWSSDWDSVVAALVVVVGCIFISNEYLKPHTGNDPISLPVAFSYKIGNFIKTTFVVVGYCANSIVDVFLGTTEANLQKKSIIDGTGTNSN